MVEQGILSQHLHPKILAVLFLLAPPLIEAAEVQVSVQDIAGKPVSEAVVFLTETEAVSPVPPAEPLIMDQIDKEFVPRLLPVVVGSRLRFPNKDNIHHHLYSFSKAKTFELPLYTGESADPVLFDKPGIVKLACNIHDWMSGIVLVLPNGHFSMTGEDGRAKIDLPEGKNLALMVYHERLVGPVDETRKVITGAEAAWKLELRAPKGKQKSQFEYR